MRDLLIEIMTEEIPHNFINNAEKSFKDVFEKFFSENKIEYKSVQTYITPRRMALIVSGLEEKQPDVSTERRGPVLSAALKGGEATKAGAGFLKGAGLGAEALADVKKEDEAKSGEVFSREQNGKEYIFVKIEQKGQMTTELLKGSFSALLSKINFPKKMRWSDKDFAFVRPIRSICAVYGEETLPLSCAGIEASNRVYGHRLLSPQGAELKAPKDYADVMKGKFVLADKEERYQTIIQSLEKIEKETGLSAVAKEKVAGMTVNLTEYPVLIKANFDESFLQLPEEVLISEMIEHQMYFPLRAADGELSSSFVITANQDETKGIREGNVRVLSARLSDGNFLYKEDLRRGIKGMNAALDTHMFRKELGSTLDKVKRMEKQVCALASAVEADEESLEKLMVTVSIMKGDLLSNMVGEFADLQGVMGAYYAEDAGFAEEICTAVREHYKPVHAKDELPSNLIGAMASVTDKLDNICAAFVVGDVPTGSQDPNGLRRSALAVINVIYEMGWSFSLSSLIEGFLKHYDSSKFVKAMSETKGDILDFIAKRFEVSLKDDFSFDAVRGVLSTGLDNVRVSRKKVEAVDAFRKAKSAEYEKLHTVYKRAANIIKDNEGVELKSGLFSEPAERALHDYYQSVKEGVDKKLSEEDYDSAFEVLASFYKPLDIFFRDVMVMCDDEELRKNRVNLLTAIDKLFLKMMDFKQLSL